MWRLCMQLSSLLMPSGERAGQSRCLVYLRVRCSNNLYPVWWHMVGEGTYSSMLWEPLCRALTVLQKDIQVMHRLYCDERPLASYFSSARPLRRNDAGVQSHLRMDRDWAILGPIYSLCYSVRVSYCTIATMDAFLLLFRRWQLNHQWRFAPLHPPEIGTSNRLSVKNPTPSICKVLRHFPAHWRPWLASPHRYRTITM